MLVLAYLLFAKIVAGVPEGLYLRRILARGVLADLLCMQKM